MIQGALETRSRAFPPGSGGSVAFAHARAAIIGEQEIAKRIWGEMDGALRAFIARWKAE